MQPMKMFFLTLLSLSLLVALPAAGFAQQSAGGPAGDVVVYLDGEPMTEQEEYTLEQDMTYQIKVENLQPNSDIELVVKFAGLFGKKKYKKSASAQGSYMQLFDTPRKRSGASIEVFYITADGVARDKQFKVKVR